MNLSKLPNDVICIIKTYYDDLIRQRGLKLLKIIDHLGFIDSSNFVDDVRSSFLHYRRVLLKCMEENTSFLLLCKIDMIGKKAAKWIVLTEQHFSKLPEKQSLIQLLSFIYTHLPMVMQSNAIDAYPDDLSSYTCSEIQSMAYLFLAQ